MEKPDWIVCLRSRHATRCAQVVETMATLTVIWVNSANKPELCTGYKDRYYILCPSCAYKNYCAS
ncbi:MAG: hypothetical protein KAS36_02345, partial [Anaerolineales bacterium]|nr:hypothetical protein [Anaerolineales bacterium]